MSISIPNFATNQFVDKDGYLLPEWAFILNQLLVELQNNYNNEGLKLPQQPTVNINDLTDPSTAASMIYDTTTSKMKVNEAGVWKTVVTT